ncbi:hypothetical protein ACLMAL_19735 [Nocardia sp. CWNU-33]|uniref:hypothetical protein n=1 Tax=Nocardia sp. CWNU-33 TaxID=3392117 RepID=UPI00398E5977
MRYIVVKYAAAAGVSALISAAAVVTSTAAQAEGLPDLELSVGCSSRAPMGQPLPAQVMVRNLGSATAHDVRVEWSIDGGPIGSHDYPRPIEPKQVNLFPLSDEDGKPITRHVRVWARVTSSDQDTNPADNEVTKDIECSETGHG